MSDAMSEGARKQRFCPDTGTQILRFAQDDKVLESREADGACAAEAAKRDEQPDM